jgi:diguanylate cyclase (GGDEF)-like protein
LISLKRYLDGTQSLGDKSASRGQRTVTNEDPAPLILSGYCAALAEFGRCTVDVCPASGQALKEGLARVGEGLSRNTSPETILAAGESVRNQLEDWGRRTARHYQVKAGEVKDILLVMARTAESVGARDQRCAQQINEVTTQLKTIANLDDLTQIRNSIEKSALELKTSIDRMTAEGRAVLEQLQAEVSAYQAKLEEAEQIASSDSLTHLRSRLWVEGQIECRMEASVPFCAAILDIDGFKRVNDEHGHTTGDELLKQFSTELRSACRSTDIIGRWGGDEFIVLLDCRLAEALAQVDPVSQWVCGNYTVQRTGAPAKLRVNASIGLAEYVPGETMKQLLDRADAEMYRHKAAVRVVCSGTSRQDPK